MTTNAVSRDRDFLGQGFAFPMQVGALGRIRLATGEEDIAQSIHIILSTVPGERVMRPTFGCRAWELLFDPNHAATHSLMEQYVREALAMWEPRIVVIEVRAARDPHEGQRMTVRIDYEIKPTHDPRSIVYPFSVADEPMDAGLNGVAKTEE